MMNSLIRKLATVSSEDIDVRPLERKIIRINSDRLLKVIHHVGDAQAMEWMRQILEVAYDVEDWIDLCIHLHGRVRADQLERIEEFIVRIDNVEERLSSQSPIGDNPHMLYAMEEDLIHHCERKVRLRRDLVLNLMDKLVVDSDQQLKVLFILGDRGIACQINHTELYIKSGGDEHQVIDNFRNFLRNKSSNNEILPKIWVCGVGPWVVLDCWWSAGVGGGGVRGGYMYFIVIDDIWTTTAWKAIKCAFADNKNGSRIITTAQIDKVSRLSYRHHTDLVVMLGGLRCTPLAIRIAAGLSLSAYPPPYSYTSAFKQYPLLQGIKRMLHISYAYLSLPLKSCLLYLSLFPENCTISKGRLIRRWAAEGFIDERDEGSIWETGESYFNELTIRQLIMREFIEDKTSNNIDLEDGSGFAVGCKVHGLVHDFIVSLSSRENMVTSDAELGSMQRGVIRRLTIKNDFSSIPKDSTQPSGSGTMDVQSINRALASAQKGKIRSLAFLGNSRLLSDVVGFKLLRVLDLEDCKSLGNEHVQKIRSLFLLRYLGLRGTGVTELQEDIGELHELQTIDVRRTRVKQLPVSVNELKKLVFLLGDGLQAQAGMTAMQNLEEVSTIDVSERSSLDMVSELLVKSN
uniref:Stripe rust resistance protein Yr10 n=1 Tax=Oryza sativa subsp. japonica TaxID=39947 RepID=Q6ZKV2_ORYSJ|nr:putative stripe rust resistance protein Yr10 [Oryza sativa Japonica Group]